MFPLKADDPYINMDGSRTTLGNVTGDISDIRDDIDTLDGKIDDTTDSITPVSQTGTKATAAITAGTYFYLGGDLVKAKTDIAIDDTFTENTNYEKVTAGGLNDLIGMVDALDGRLDTAETNITNLQVYLDYKVAPNVKSTDTGTLVSREIISGSGLYFLVLDSPTIEGSASAYIVRYVGTDYYVTPVYEGETTTSPIITSAGVLKTRNSTIDGVGVRILILKHGL